MTKTQSTLRILVTLLAISVPLNFIWEIAQMPLYVVDGTLLEFAVHCIVPSLGDGVMVLIIFGLGWMVFRRAAWFIRPGLFAGILMLTTGFIIAVVVEWVAVVGIGRWTYATSMPVLPLLNVGLSPVLQMLLLPPLIFKAAAWWLDRPGSRPALPRR